MNSKLYLSNPGKKNFIGFAESVTIAGEDCEVDENADGTKDGSLVSSVGVSTNIGTGQAKEGAIGIADVVGSVDSACTLGITTYKMGVGGHLSGKTFIGMNVSQNGVLKENDEGEDTDVFANGNPESICT